MCVGLGISKNKNGPANKPTSKLYIQSVIGNNSKEAGRRPTDRFEFQFDSYLITHTLEKLFSLGSLTLVLVFYSGLKVKAV